MIWKQFLYNFMGLLNGPVKNALFCFMDRYQNVCVWFMARSCRVPEVGTHASQPGNHGLPLQRTSSSWRLELMVPNVGTKGYHGKELPVPRPWNLRFPTWEPEVTIYCKELPVPRHPKAWNSWFQTWKSNVTSGRICWLQKIRTHGSSCCFVLFTEWVTENFVLLPGPVTECLRSAAGPA